MLYIVISYGEPYMIVLKYLRRWVYEQYLHTFRMGELTFGEMFSATH